MIADLLVPAEARADTEDGRQIAAQLPFDVLGFADFTQRGQGGDMGRRIDRTGDDQPALQCGPRLAHEVERITVDRPIGEEVDTGAAERVGAPTILGDPSAVASQPGRMAFRPSDKGTAANRGTGDRSLHRGNVGAAEQAVDADLARSLCRASGVGGRQADDFEITRRTGRLDASVEAIENIRTDADILEADMADAEIGYLIENLEAILDRQIVASQHEDEIHDGAQATRISATMIDTMR